jgi:hypothetical protein
MIMLALNQIDVCVASSLGVVAIMAAAWPTDESVVFFAHSMQSAKASRGLL